jgi:hypothetical protein
MKSIMLTSLIVGAMVIVGCAHGAKDIDESKIDSACAQRCSILHSRCVSEMNMMSSPMMSKCNEAYDGCMGSCPAK